MRTRANWKSPLTVALLLAARGQALAEPTSEPAKTRLEIGAFGGAFVPSAGFALYDLRTSAPRPFTPVALDVGIRGAIFPLRWLGVEVEGAVIPTEAVGNGPGNTLLYSAGAHLLAQIGSDWAVKPFLLAGAGILGASSSAVGNDSDRGGLSSSALGNGADVVGHWGVGLKFGLPAGLLVRLDLRQTVAPPGTFSTGIRLHHEALLGLSKVFDLGGAPAEASPPGTASDGSVATAAAATTEAQAQTSTPAAARTAAPVYLPTTPAEVADAPRIAMLPPAARVVEQTRLAKLSPPARAVEIARIAKLTPAERSSEARATIAQAAASSAAPVYVPTTPAEVADAPRIAMLPPAAQVFEQTRLVKLSPPARAVEIARIAKLTPEERSTEARATIAQAAVTPPKPAVRVPPQPPEPPDSLTVDSDGDGIVNAKDLAPYEPEDFNGFEDDDGVPDRGIGARPKVPGSKAPAPGPAPATPARTGK